MIITVDFKDKKVISVHGNEYREADRSKVEADIKRTQKTLLPPKKMGSSSYEEWIKYCLLGPKAK